MTAERAREIRAEIARLKAERDGVGTPDDRPSAAEGSDSRHEDGEAEPPRLLGKGA